MRRLSRELLTTVADIELLIFDVDGVMTNNHILVINKGLEAKAFSVADGFAFKLARRAPIKFAIISARYAEPTLVRGTELGISDIYQQPDKFNALDDLLKKHNLTLAQVGHVGNDLPDIPLMERVGLAICTANAEPEVLPYAHYQTELPGGRGCCREVIKFVLQAKGIDFLELYRKVIADAEAS
ncbi:MAG: HAD hydrolase family protein [candidate division Zixibacteria bacterium]|nr:HAD hydrolase family protein [candidate division Zixibacteria bacterium]